MAAKEKINDQKPEDQTKGGLTNLRLGRAAALEISAILLIIIIAIILRVLPLRWGAYLNEYDPFFWYRITEYIAKNGYAAYFTWHDTLSWYPMGRDIAHSSYPGNPFTAVFIWQVLNTVGFKVDLFNVALFFPVLMASITCVAAYFFGKDFGGKAVGIFTGLLMAVSPSYISRTVVGFFDTENIGIFGMVLTSLFFMRSLKQEKTIQTQILYAVAGGLSMGYAFASWGAARYISSLLLLYIGVTLLLGKIERRHIISYAITIGVGFLVAIMIPRLGVSYIMNIENLSAIGAVGLLLIYELIKTRLPESQARLSTVGLVSLALIAFLLLPYVGIGNPIAGKFLRVINPFEEVNPLFSSVGEHKISSWSVFFSDFGVSIILAILGTYFALKEGDENKIYALLFFITTIYFAGTLVRLTLILAFPASLMAAYGLVKLLEPFKIITVNPEESRSKKKRAQAMGMSRGISVIFILLLVLSFIPHFINASNTASGPGPLAQSSVPVLIDGDYPKDWIHALNWLKANTTQDSIICSWWDYGYWIEGVANRTTLADGATMNRTQIVNIAHMLLKTQNESLPLMQKYGVDYVLVFVTYNPNTPTEEWPFGDNAKWPQMARIAGYNLTDFYSQDTQTGQTYYTKKFLNTTIASMMTGNVNKTHFIPVYNSQHGWVRVYKVLYSPIP